MMPLIMPTLWILFMIFSAGLLSILTILYSSLSTVERLIILLIATMPFTILIFSATTTIIHYRPTFQSIYDNHMKSLQNFIEGDENYKEDLVNFAFLSALINFMILYFLQTVSLQSLLSKIPIFDSSTTEKIEIDTVFDISNFLGDDLLLMLPFVVLGPIILYIFRQIHYKSKKKSYPGTRGLLIFIYSMTGVIIYYHLDSFGGNKSPN